MPSRPRRPRAADLATAVRHAPLSAGVLLSLGGAAPVIVVPALYPRMATDLPGFGTGSLGLATSVFFAVSSLTSPLAGAAVDRMGRRLAARVAGLGSVAVIAAVAVAPSVHWLLATFALGGLMQALAITSSALLLSATLGSRRQATQFALKQTSVPALSLLAGSALAIAGVVSWRWIVLGFAAFPALAVLWRPESAEEAPRGAPGRRIAGTDRPPPSTMLLFVAVGALAGAAVSVLATFGVVALIEAGWSTAAAGSIYAAAAALSLVVRVGSGVWTDRGGRRALPSVAILLALGAVGFAFLATGTRAGALVGVVAAYGFGWSYSGLLLFVVARAFPLSVARSTGWLMAGAAVGISAGPVTFSAAQALIGPTPAWIGVAVVSGTAAAIAGVGGHWVRPPAHGDARTATPM